MKALTIATALISLLGLAQTSPAGTEAHHKVMVKTDDVTLQVDVDDLAEGQTRTARSGDHTLTVTRKNGRLAVSVDGKALELPPVPAVPAVPAVPGVPPIPAPPEVMGLPDGIDSLVIDSEDDDGTVTKKVVRVKRVHDLDERAEELEERIRQLQERIRELEAERAGDDASE